MKKNKNLIIICVLVVIILAGSTTAFAWSRHKKSTPPQTPTGINLSPATSADKSRDEATKQQIEDQQKQSAANSSTPAMKTVTPTITYAGQYNGQVQVGARVSGLVETSGTCEASLTRNGTTVKKQVTAVRDASSMDCPEMDFDSTDVTTGTWSVTVSYSSSTASGTSPSQTFEVN